MCIRDSAYILRVGGQMLLIALLGAVATITVGLLGSQIAAGLARNLRRVLFEKVMRFSGAEFEHFSTASLITRATNDITQVQNVMGIMVRMVCLLYTSPSPRDRTRSRMPSSA